MEEELPHIEHRTCARHIYGNIKKLHPNKPRFKNLFWAVANSFNEGDYKAALKELKAFDSQIYDDLMVRDPTTCTRAFFSTTPSCEDGLNNFSESYNSGLKKARSLPLVGMLETMRRQAMVRIEVRKKKLVKYKAKYSLKVAKTIAEETKIANGARYRKFSGTKSAITSSGTKSTTSLNSGLLSYLCFIGLVIIF